MPYILKKYYPLRNIFFFLGEGALIFIAISSVYLFVKGPDEYSFDLLLFTSRALIVTFIFQICLYYFDLYDLSISSTFSDIATRIAQAFGFGCIALGIIYYLFPIIIISTKIFWTGYIAICISIALWRFFYSIVLDRRMFTQPILLLGAGKLAEKIAEEIDSKRDSGYKIIAYLASTNPSFNHGNVPFYDNEKTLPELIKQHTIEKIVVALDDRRGKTPIEELMTCKLAGMLIVKGERFFEELTGKIMVEKINPDAIIFSEGFKKNRLIRLLKRLVDILTASLGLIISFPCICICSLAIKIDSPGPIFYFQERVGEKGKLYKLIKFRSMTVNAEQYGPVWAGKNDNRVTKVGGFIRKVRIDEIPQMWNVLKGEMSFVGPRPERPVFVDQLKKIIPYYSLRHNVKPGITGWAQICYPYGATEEDALRKLEYDLYYIKNMSLRMDLLIIFQTIKTVLFQKGAR
jgi:sugar transferase (PEP-CTERM system associated)